MQNTNYTDLLLELNETKSQLQILKREIEIENALEKIRTKTLSMQSSEDILSTTYEVFHVLEELGIQPLRSGIGIVIDQDKRAWDAWNITSDTEGKKIQTRSIFTSDVHWVSEGIFNHWKNQDSFWLYDLSGDKLKDFVHLMPRNYIPADEKSGTLPFGVNRVVFHYSSFPEGFLFVGTAVPLSSGEISILKRSTQVFALAYKRFLDLQNTEELAREAQIEAALERVRARTMAMSNSTELREVVAEFFGQVQALGIEIQMFVIFIFKPDGGFEWWGTEFGEEGLPHSYDIPPLDRFKDHPRARNLIKIWKEKTPYQVFELSCQEKKSWDEFLLKNTGLVRLPEHIKKGMRALNKIVLCDAACRHGILEVASPIALTKEEAQILQRFARVFEQTYTRFRDVQKAEEQAREAQIEAALERVRSRTMAMHHTRDLQSIIGVVFKELNNLQLQLTRVAIWIFDEDTYSARIWIANPEIDSSPEGFMLPHNELPPYQGVLNAWKNKAKIWQFLVQGTVKKEWEQYLFTKTDFSEFIPQEIKSVVQNAPHYTFYASLHDFGCLHCTVEEPLSAEELALYQRFGNVFNQSYKRFLDLQKAEAQAREAQIEAALERVRARTMAMQKSSELGEAAEILYKQLMTLGLTFIRSGYALIDETKEIQTLYLTSPGGVYIESYNMPLTGNKVLDARYESWKNQESVFSQRVGGQDLKDHIKFVAPHFGSTNEKEIAKQMPDPIIYYCGNFQHGYLHLHTVNDLSKEHRSIVARFSKVFEMTYKRFLDLRKAEAQAREAQIEAALERVRSRTMAMHNSEELGDVANILYEELISLGISNFLNCGFIIVKEEEGEQYGWMTQPGGTFEEKLNLPYPGDRVLQSRLEAWKEKLPVFFQKVGGETLARHLEYVAKHSHSQHQVETIMPLMPDPTYFYCGNFSEGYLHILSGENLGSEAEIILARFSKVFEQTYTRFIDLQKAEAQALEARIEAALEKVRSRSLAMHKADELGEVVTVVLEKLRELEIPVDDGVAIVTHIEDSKDQIEWMENPGFSSALKIYQKYFEHPILFDYWKAKEEGLDFITPRYSAEENKSFLNHIFEHTEYKHTPPEIKDYCLAADTYSYSAAFQKNSSIFINHYSGRSLSEREIDIVKRFARVFEQGYIRFLDLQKAEEQAREAQIETALERVRSRTMAMQRSDELTAVATILFQQVLALGVPMWTCGMNVWETGDKEFTFYPGDPDGTLSAEPCKIPLTEHPVFISFDESRRRGDDLFMYEKEGEFQADHYRYMMTLPGVRELLQSMLDAGFQFPTFQIDHLANFSHGNLLFVTYEHVPEMHDVFKRFAKVFEQTYTRFLDLKNAEEQAREAQIEAALEQVRGSSMAMHQSNELVNTVAVMFDRLQKLQFGLDGAVILGIPVPDTREADYWLADTEQAYPFCLRLPYHDSPPINDIWAAYESGDQFITRIYPSHEKNLWFEYAFKHTALNIVPDDRKKWILDQEYLSQTILTSDDFILGIHYHFEKTLSQEEVNILRRFSNVFQQSYTRFLDIQKAEEQAREAQIEAALERIRSRSMAMQHSKELTEVSNLLNEQVRSLGTKTWGCAFNIYGENESMEWFGTEAGLMSPYPTPREGVFKRYYERGQAGETLYVEEFAGEKCSDHYEYMCTLPVLGEMLNNIKAAGHSFPTFQIDHVAYFKYGYLLFITLEPAPEAHDIFKRFAKVFEQTYTRFLDLQKSEAQAREAIKQASLDRVRAEIASMRTTEDLNRITPLIWQELQTLGVPFFRCGVFIVDDKAKKIDSYLSSPEGESLATWRSGYDTIPLFAETVRAWRKQEVFQTEWDKEAFISFSHTLIDQGLVDDRERYQAGKDAPDHLVLQMVPFKQGMLYVGSDEKLNQDQIDLVESLASSFSVAYARYEDFRELENAKEKVEKTLRELQATQSQLVHAEKMASLGELTAGIAHEIQNPLNFVNNFSDVNQELLEELSESINTKNWVEVEEILQNLRENENKVMHHGRRAEEIVRSMLLHSRGNEGERELTNINALCDEYLRLAFHGFRARYKSFQVQYELDLDESIPKINVVAQDIGRVLLNLINNAFQAVTGSEDPHVTVTTKNLNGEIMITVADNGPGVPDNIRDKIFQPFFTTKPAGQGTGLGLSLAYDIVKSHGGELKVETGDGTNFMILLRASN